MDTYSTSSLAQPRPSAAEALVDELVRQAGKSRRLAVQAIRCRVGKESIDDMENKERDSMIEVFQICAEQWAAVLMPSKAKNLLVRMI